VSAFLNLKNKKYGKYTLHRGGHSYYWMAGWIFRVSRGGHHSCSARYCSNCHSNKAYPGKKRIVNPGRDAWSLRPATEQTNNDLPGKWNVCTHSISLSTSVLGRTADKIFIFFCWQTFLA